mmetsp:Transcript_57865/g.102822  ORF Transcript_57865/g.102822 Transcript_57865/m.102822 type:complete len:400 (+) Transcript_57865:73-1272(+)
MVEEERHRPGTAPVRRSVDGWAEVDALVRDMLGSVASSSSSSVKLPRRPHTACAGARALATVVVEGAEDSDTESDGASLDPYDDDEPEVPAQASTSGYPSRNSGTSRPATASHPAKVAEAHLSTESSKTDILVLNAPELPKDAKLLLGGGLWGYASGAKADDKSTRPSSSGSTTARSVPKPLPASMAEKLPRRCVQLSARPAMAPRAARMSSHNSWANHLPVRPPISVSGAGAAGDRKKPGLRTRNGYGAEVSSPKRPTSAEKIQAKEAAQGLEKAAAAVDLSTEPPQSPKKRGPKYRVLPGGSRPALEAAGSKASQHEFMVLEFRTEPRVVPARRSILREESGAVDMAALSSFAGKSPPPAAQLARSAKKGLVSVPRFRQDSSKWALEREALAAQAGC